MATLIEQLRTGIFTVAKEHDDGSVFWFECTASPLFLNKLGLDPTKIYNLQNRTIVSEEEISCGRYRIISKKEESEFSDLDQYLNRGIVNERNYIR